MKTDWQRARSPCPCGSTRNDTERSSRMRLRPRKSRRRTDTNPNVCLSCKPLLEVGIGGVDQLAESRGVRFAIAGQFHVAHAFAAALEQPCGIFERRTVEEAHIHVVLERVD